MTAFPPSIRARVQDLLWQDRRPAYLRVTAEGTLRASGGPLGSYGLSVLDPGCDVAEAAPFLLGLVPAVRGEEPLVLPSLDLGAERVADVLVFDERGDTWVVLLDTTASHEKRQALQQAANELALLQPGSSGVPGGGASGRGGTDPVATSSFTEEGGRRDVTVVHLEVRSKDLGDLSNPGHLVLDVEAAASRAVSSFRQAGAFSEISLGGAVTAVFDTTQGDTVPAERAVNGTLALLDPGKNDAGLAFAAGVASGPCDLALVVVAGGQRPQVVGGAVARAGRLAASAISGQVVIDGRSFSNLGPTKSAFRQSGVFPLADGTTMNLYASQEP